MQAGDAVILNAANSCVGQLIVQLCKSLRLRCIALVRDHGRLDRTRAWLEGLGATAVFEDATFSKVSIAWQLASAMSPVLRPCEMHASSAMQRSGGNCARTGVMSCECLQASLDQLKFFARPKVAFDSVGGESAGRLAAALAEVGVGWLPWRVTAWLSYWTFETIDPGQEPLHCCMLTCTPPNVPAELQVCMSAGWGAGGVWLRQRQGPQHSMAVLGFQRPAGGQHFPFVSITACVPQLAWHGIMVCLPQSCSGLMPPGAAALSTNVHVPATRLMRDTLATIALACVLYSGAQ